ncbi:DinB family protein, partial [Staphylococcus gallinarum]|uniref:DinB family protein n=1 Tax=Staphylococcus gallinarum TaxID=1293 RepID=UPI000E6A5149
MSNITVYNVIELGVNNLLADYDNWNVEEVLDKETQHFQNTLHWQYGHVLTNFEQALSLGNQHVVDVEKYNKLFGYGSNPRDWKGQDVPAINEIKQHIPTLPERAKKLTHEQLAQKLDQPIAGCKTLDELLMLIAIHVPLYTGKIE